jgi:hypothetical protein
MAETSPAYSLSPTDIASLPELFETALPDLVPTPPLEDNGKEGLIHPGEPWICTNVYSFTLLPLHARHFNTDEGLRPLSFIHFVVQD